MARIIISVGRLPGRQALRVQRGKARITAGHRRSGARDGFLSVATTLNLIRKAIAAHDAACGDIAAKPMMRRQEWRQVPDRHDRPTGVAELATDSCRMVTAERRAVFPEAAKRVQSDRDGSGMKIVCH
ncbi:hypothetical protein P7L64_02520 (plasmid) [Tistrella bauzanensis]|uniref:hypothetical protein n=1 Tax=Tistrella bauzanensis TaxID=657419 RepID=UPI001662C64B|nr:hypothetical protein [Tistrella bauzanensis]